MPLSIIQGTQRTAYPDASHAYVQGGLIVITNGPPDNHTKNIVFAMLPLNSACIIQNDGAMKHVAGTDSANDFLQCIQDITLRPKLDWAVLRKIKRELESYNSHINKWKP